MTAVLRRAEYGVNRKRVLRLMRPMGLAAIYPKPALSYADPDHRVYPYLLRGVPVTGPDHGWSTDLTHLTPTLVAFWLAVFDVAQVVGCARQKKAGLAKLWWKMTENRHPAAGAGGDAGHRGDLHCPAGDADRSARPVRRPCSETIGR